MARNLTRKLQSAPFDKIIHPNIYTWNQTDLIVVYTTIVYIFDNEKRKWKQYYTRRLREVSANHMAGSIQITHLSFAHYHNPERMHFGVLRVLNDDFVDGGKGFGTHPHDNMEIISIPLSGDLEHKDSMGNTTVIKQNDVQIMSAGTGIQHSEYNRNKDKKVNFLQIWVFPKVRNIMPRYGQLTFNPVERINNLQQIVSSKKEDAGVWINQDACFHLGNLKNGFSTEYKIKHKGNGVYAFVIDGDVTINDQKLNKRDGLGIWDVENFSLRADSDAEILLMEVPMN
ncbi:MAG: pirin family protein [Cytophagales bacterium]|nr:pirin family protein [Cytophagales bacterium]